MTSFLNNHPDLWQGVLPRPLPEGHKYSRGTVLVRGGVVMTGAARLGARAAQRMGASLVTIAVPQSVVPIYSSALESIIIQSCDGLALWQNFLNDKHQPAILIGPGLGQEASMRDEVLATLATRRPCVIDADALTLFAGDEEHLFAGLHENCVLTPHEGEFARLFPNIEGDKVTRAVAAAARAECAVVLKGAQTVIATPKANQVIVNTNAPPWLATAGAGDVLAGMIVGLLTQKMPVFYAAAAATWLHGFIATRHGLGLIAEDLVAGIPLALGYVYKSLGVDSSL